MESMDNSNTAFKRFFFLKKSRLMAGSRLELSTSWTTGKSANHKATCLSVKKGQILMKYN